MLVLQCASQEPNNCFFFCALISCPSTLCIYSYTTRFWIWFWGWGRGWIISFCFFILTQTHISIQPYIHTLSPLAHTLLIFMILEHLLPKLSSIFSCIFVCLLLFQYLYPVFRNCCCLQNEKPSIHRRIIYRKNIAEEIAWCFRAYAWKCERILNGNENMRRCIKTWLMAIVAAAAVVLTATATICPKWQKRPLCTPIAALIIFRLIIGQNLIKTEMRNHYRDLELFACAHITICLECISIG